LDREVGRAGLGGGARIGMLDTETAGFATGAGAGAVTVAADW
jgi:hypothetical protein